MSFIPRINNLGINSEDIIDLTDTDIFSDVKTEELENDCIFVEDKDVEILEVIPPKAEENKICTKGNFETIFLPEIYTGVAVETPFFDIISYKKKCGLSTEDVDTHKSDMYMNSSNRDSNFQNVKQEEDQFEDKSVYNHHKISSINNNLEMIENETYEYYNKNELILDSNDSDPTDTNMKTEINVYKYRDVGMQGMRYENRYNYRTPLNNMYQNNLPVDIINQCDNPLAQTYLRREFNNIEPVASYVVDSRVQQDRQSQSEEDYQNPSSSISTSRLISSNNERKLYDEQGKYECPICKIPKTFYTLSAVNNHLKFDHIIFFNIKKKAMMEDLM